jgi:hypothetical protein
MQTGARIDRAVFEKFSGIFWPAWQISSAFLTQGLYEWLFLLSPRRQASKEGSLIFAGSISHSYSLRLCEKHMRSVCPPPEDEQLFDSR